MRETDKLGLIVWDSNSDEFDHQDLENNWDNLEALLRPTQAGSASIAQGGYTSTAIGGQTILNKSTTVVFTDAFADVPIVTASSSLLGTWVTLSGITAAQFDLTVNTLRNDSASFGAVTVLWHAILP